MTDEVIERVARLICTAAGYEPDDEVRWLVPGTDYEEGEPYDQWEEYRQQAEAAIKAYEQSLRPGDTLGEYVVVPREAVETMVRAGAAHPTLQHYRKMVEAEMETVVGSPAPAPITAEMAAWEIYRAMLTALTTEDSTDA